MRNARASKIWRLRIPLKVKVFCSLVLKKKSLTVNNLLKRGWIGDTAYVLCWAEEETVNHLFTICIFAKFILAITVKGVQSRDLGVDVNSV